MPEERDELPQRRPTIQDVARLAGVSRSTVSNALNNRDKRLSVDTADRVRKACATLGFVPDELARQLRRGHARIIGLVVPSVANPFWGEFVRAAEEAARVHEFTVLVASSDRSPERERSYTEAMFRQGIRAVIFGSSPVRVSHLADLAERGMQIVSFDRRFRKGDVKQIDSITVDNLRGGELATEALINLGHRRIGFLSGPIKTASRRDRFSGYKRALQSAGIAFRSEWVWAGSGISMYGDPDAGELGRVGALALSSNGTSVSALVAINDMYALGAYAGLRSIGISVPRDMSVIGFDDIALTGLIEPALSTIHQPIGRMVTLAVGRLVERLSGGQVGHPMREEFAPKLILRQSTASCAN